MSSLRTKISEVFAHAFKACGYDKQFGMVVESQRPELGQFQCNGALPIAKIVKDNPRNIAKQLIDQINGSDLFDKLTIEGPGFINISVKDSFLAQHCRSIANDERLGNQIPVKLEKIIIDFGGPNVAKPMHVGHLRSSIIGDSLQRLYRVMGHTVISDNHMGDWGTQMGMLINEMEKRQPDLPYFDKSFKSSYPKQPPVSITDLEEMYPVASLHCKTYPDAMAQAVKTTNELQLGRVGYIALWKHFVNLSVETLQRDFTALNVYFDHWLGESFYMEHMKILVEKLKKSKIAEESEGALVINVAHDNDKKEIPPVMLVKSGGGFLYATSDIATIDYRMNEFKPSKILYVVDKRQGLHFEQVFRAVRKANVVSDNIILKHIGFGTVNGKDGKPFKTRAGGVMKLKELITQVTDKARERMDEAGIASDLSVSEREEVAIMVGLAALKFADLMNHRTSNYIFDIDKFCRFEGKTGPYLQYTAVRIKSILRKAKIQKLSFGDIINPSGFERQLMITLSQLPDIIESTAENNSPNFLCDYAYTLAQEFNRFYRECHILNEKEQQRQSSWLSLIAIVLRELELVLSILGIKIPDRM